MEQQSIILHTCCAPCSTYAHIKLTEEYNVVPFFYNPNIAPFDEYNRRLNELQNYAKLKGFNMFTGIYDNKRWTSLVEEFKSLGERSERCYHCFKIRLTETFNKAQSLNIDIITTTLTISPHKDADVINSIGRELSHKYGIKFLEQDLKKNNGFKNSVELSKKHNFYRQKYCGCIYSKMECGL